MRVLTIMITLLSLSQLGYGQDTLSYYHVNTYSKTGKRVKNVYKINGRSTTKSKYKKIRTTNDNLGKCTPCYLKNLDKNGKLLYIALQNQDALIGAYQEFHKNGKLKIDGHYDRNRKTGTWTYYDHEGKLLKTEEYKYGNLVSTDYPKT